MSVTESFERFTGELRERLQAAKAAGISDQAIKQRAEEIGDYLSQNVNPQSPEQRVLQELWRVADQQEQQAIANCMVKLVERQGSHIH